jgi:PAS domain S-box-containing protein
MPELPEIDVETLLKHLVDTFYRTNIEGRIVYVSPSVEKLIGYTVEELLETQLADLYAEKEHRQQFLQQLQKNNGEIAGFQAPLRHKNGSEVWVATNATYHYDRDGRVAGVEGITRNITTEHQTQEEQARYRDDLEKLVKDRTTELQKENVKGLQREEALQKSEEMLQLVMNNIPQAVFWKDRNSTYLGCNQILAKDVGFDRPEDVIGKTDYDFSVTKEQADSYRDDDQQIMESGKPLYHIHETLRKPDGSQAWLDTNKIPLHDEHNDVIGVLGTYEDITERKQTEIALLESKNMWKKTFDTIPDMISIVNKKHEMIRVNRATADRLGKSIDHLLHTPCYRSIHGTDAPPAYCPHSKLLIDHKEHAVEIFNEHLKTHLHVTVSPLYDGKNKLIGSVHIARDISKQKQQEVELKKFNEKLQDLVAKKIFEIQEKKNLLASIFRAAPAGIGVVKNRVITHVNPTMERITGYSSQELIEQSARMLYPDDEEFNFVGQEKYRQIHESGSGTVETKWLCKDGTVIDVLLSSTPINPKNLDNGVTFLALDITARKNVKKELKSVHKQLLHAEKLSAVGRFSASIAHEMNNPLQGVLNVVRGVQERATLAEIDQELVDLALKECHRMKELIKKLQQFNKPTSGTRAALNIHQVIDEVLLFAKKKFRDKKITVKKEYAASLPEIWAVADQIKQVLINILGNAGDAIVPGGDTITLATSLQNEKHISISIKDCGEGISPENLKKIFEPFYSTRAIKGTGLGLFVSYGIIKSHGGDITVESKAGQGTTFTITLPIEMRQISEEKDSGC